MGKSDVVKHMIDTGTEKPTKQAPRIVPMHQVDAVEEAPCGIEQVDVISPSDSRWSSPIVMVKKKDETCRFFIDYHQYVFQIAGDRPQNVAGFWPFWVHLLYA